MTGADPLPGALAADAAVDYWSVVWAQLRKNRVAMFAFGCVKVLLTVAVAAPVLAFNVPFVARTGDTWSAPFVDLLFDGFVFPGGVDVFFNLLLLLVPVWALAARLGRSFRPAGEGREGRVLPVVLGVPLALYLGFGAAVGTGAGTVGRLLLAAGLPGAILAFWAASRDRAVRARTGRAARWALFGVFVGAFVLLLGPWSETRPLVDWRARSAGLEAKERARWEQAEALRKDPAKRGELAVADPGLLAELEGVKGPPGVFHDGWAVFPPIHFHPDNIGELGPEPTRRSLKKPDGENWLGCDLNGRDVTARLLFGTRISMTIGLVAVSIFIAIGVLLGSLAGYYQGWVDLLISRLVEVMICFPTLFLLLTIIAIFESRSIFLIMAVIGLVGWPGVSRLVRGEFLRQRNLDYVTAAQAQGIPQRRIIFGHVLPNCMGPVLVSATFGIASSILTESSLAFLGLGDTTAASWGQMLNSGRSEGQWHLILVPGIAIFFVVTTFNLLGEGLRDALDPKLRR